MTDSKEIECQLTYEISKCGKAFKLCIEVEESLTMDQFMDLVVQACIDDEALDIEVSEYPRCH